MGTPLLPIRNALLGTFVPVSETPPIPPSLPCCLQADLHRQIFELIDADGTGTITLRELARGMVGNPQCKLLLRRAFGDQVNAIAGNVQRIFKVRRSVWSGGTSHRALCPVRLSVWRHDFFRVVSLLEVCTGVRTTTQRAVFGLEAAVSAVSSGLRVVAAGQRAGGAVEGPRVVLDGGRTQELDPDGDKVVDVEEFRLHCEEAFLSRTAKQALIAQKLFSTVVRPGSGGRAKLGRVAVAMCESSETKMLLHYTFGDQRYEEVCDRRASFTACHVDCSRNGGRSTGHCRSDFASAPRSHIMFRTEQRVFSLLLSLSLSLTQSPLLPFVALWMCSRGDQRICTCTADSIFVELLPRPGDIQPSCNLHAIAISEPNGRHRRVRGTLRARLLDADGARPIPRCLRCRRLGVGCAAGRRRGWRCIGGGSCISRCSVGGGGRRGSRVVSWWTPCHSRHDNQGWRH